MTAAAAGAAETPRGLVWLGDDSAGIRRIRVDDGFAYRGVDGRRLRDAAELQRIRALAIPPAYEDVWICPKPNGHLQATGRDARGRKQYRYHAGWRQARDGSKFEHLADFGRALPAIRARVEADLNRRDISRQRVLATVVRLLEQTLIRVGNDECARSNKSFGLTTLRNRHLKVEGSALKFEFRGKSGVKHVGRITDRRLANVVRRLRDIPGQRLFQYIGDDGTPRAVGSADVNAYLREAGGGDFTAKDFRTWAATLAAATHLADLPPPDSAADARRHVVDCIKGVSEQLRNTPAVCRSSYIHPAVLTAFAEAGLTGFGKAAHGEAALLRFLKDLASA